jgi:hypothetical protein
MAIMAGPGLLVRSQRGDLHDSDGQQRHGDSEDGDSYQQSTYLAVVVRD